MNIERLGNPYLGTRRLQRRLEDRLLGQYHTRLHTEYRLDGRSADPDPYW